MVPLESLSLFNDVHPNLSHSSEECRWKTCKFFTLDIHVERRNRDIRSVPNTAHINRIGVQAMVPRIYWNRLRVGVVSHLLRIWLRMHRFNRTLLRISQYEQEAHNRSNIVLNDCIHTHPAPTT